MKLTFLGTGGGRFVMYRQLRGTGGFVLEIDDEKIHIDPGPGASLRSKMYGINPEELTGIIVTHNHTDHVTEAPVIIEGMTYGGLRKKGFLLAGKSVLEGEHETLDMEPSISAFHKNAPEIVRVMKPGDSFDTGKIKIKATPTNHGDPNNFGVIFEGSKRVGYTSDSLYFEGMGEYFEGCDYLIINMAYGREYPENVITREHLLSSDVVKIVNNVKPKKVFLVHIGLELMGHEKEEQDFVIKETGVECIVPDDGQSFEL